MKAVLLFLIFFSGIDFENANTGLIAQNFDKAAYYHVLKTGSTTDINNQIEIIDASVINNKDAFKGALLMKKAGLADVPKQKLEFFKSGRIKLETAIKNDSTNTEYRFLRLIIQEHAPKQAKYQAQLKTDADFISKHFKSLSPELQDIIIDYSKQSKTLTTASLQ